MTNQYHLVMSYVNRQYSAFEIRKKITQVDIEKVMHMADSISCDSELNKELEKVIKDLKVLKFEKKRLRKRRASHGEVLAKRICRKSVKASIKEKNVLSPFRTSSTSSSSRRNSAANRLASFSLIELSSKSPTS